MAAREALKHATPVGKSMSIFAPFDTYPWPCRPLPGAPPVHPVGVTPAEAGACGWLLSCALHVDEPTTVALSHQLGYATRLEREARVLGSLYERLTKPPPTLHDAGLRAGTCNGLVPFSVVEKTLQLEWGESVVQCEGMLRKVDTHLWCMLEACVRGSVEEHVASLERALSSLGGLASGQLDQRVSGAMNGFSRSVSNRITEELLRRGASKATLLSKLQRLADDLMPSVVADAKRRIQEDLRAVKILRSFTILTATELDQVVQECDYVISALAACPPHALEKQFAQRSLGFEELRAAFPQTPNGLVGLPTSVPPASIGVRGSMLAAWLEQSGPRVKEACNASIAALQRAATRQALMVNWSDVTLSKGSALHGAAAPLPLPMHTVAADDGSPPSHTLTLNGLCEGSALRCARVIAVLQDEVRLDLLPVGAIHPAALSPIVLRLRSEREVAYAACVAQQLRPIGARAGLPWPGDAGGPADRCKPLAHAIIAAPQASQAPVQSTQLVLQVDASSVHSSLLRDHAILYALLLCLEKRRNEQSVHVSLNEVVVTVKTISPIMKDHTEASAVQAVRWVCNKVIDLSRPNFKAPTGSIRYVSSCGGGVGRVSGGVTATDAGCLYLRQYVTWCVSQMRGNGGLFSNVWHSSRSSRCRARTSIKKRERVAPAGVPADVPARS